MSTQKRRRRRLRSAVKAQAYSLLSSIPEAPSRPVSVAASDGTVRVMVVVSGIDGPAAAGVAPEGVKGLFLSPIEAAIVNALQAAGGVALSGKVLASRVSQEYDTRMKYVLVNLEDRQVISHESGQGYRVASAASRT